MANNDFDRTVMNLRERPLSSDINQLQAQLDRSLRESLAQEGMARLSANFAGNATPYTQFIGEGFHVVPGSGLQVVIKAGLGLQYLPSGTVANGDPAIATAIGGIAGVDDLSPFKPLVLMADANIAINAVPGIMGQSRIDLIEVLCARRLDNSSSRDVLDPASGVFNPTAVNKTLDFTLDGTQGTVVSPANSTTAIGYKVGVAGAPGVAPATSPGYTPIAYVVTHFGDVSIDSIYIPDFRDLYYPNGLGKVAFKITVPSAGGAVVQPTISNVIGPAGVIIKAVAGQITGTDSDGSAAIFIAIPGTALSTVIPRLSMATAVVAGGGDPGKIWVPQIASMVIGTATSSTSPTIPQGMKFLNLLIYSMQQAAGATTLAEAPSNPANPTTYWVELAYGR